MTEEEITKFQTFFEAQLDRKVLPISGVSGRNIDNLKALMIKCIDVEKEDRKANPEPDARKIIE
jgi:GTP-binding protein